MTPAERVVTVVLVTVSELVALAISVVLGFVGVLRAAEVSFWGYRPAPSERRIGFILVAVAIVLPAIVPFCVWIKFRFKVALTLSGVLLALGAVVWLSLLAT